MHNRKVILYIAMSLDGYIAREDGSIDWLDALEMTEEDTTYEDFYQMIDTVVLGRKTFDQIQNELSPEVYPYEGVRSFVMTSKVQENSGNIYFVDKDIRTLIKKIKHEPGKNIWIVGGNSIIQPLVKENLIDEYIIAVVPTILGSGIPLFGDIDKEIPLKHIKSYTKNQLTYMIFENE